MTTMIQYVLTLVIAGVLGLNAQGEAKSHKDKSHKEESRREKKERKKERKKEKKHHKDRDALPIPVIAPEPIKLPDPEIAPQPSTEVKTEENVQVGSSVPK